MSTPNPEPTTPHPTSAHPRVAPWLFAVGGLSLALVFACGPAPRESHTPAPTPVGPTTVVLSPDAQGGLGVRGPHILVDGIAVIEVVPDVVDLTVVLSIQRSTPKQAVVDMRAEQRRMVAALKLQGVSGVDLRTSQLSVSPVYGDYPRHRIEGYVAELTFVASLRDFDRIADVLEAASSFEVSNLYTRFRSTEMAAKKKELRDMALRAARDKARQSTAVLEVVLGQVVSIEEVSRSDRASWGTTGNMMVNEFSSASFESQSVVPGAIRLDLTVEVQFALAGPA